jgi:hypothetical protein
MLGAIQRQRFPAIGRHEHSETMLLQYDPQ